MGNLSVKLTCYCLLFDLETPIFIQQSVIESGMMAAETLEETIESGPLCITDLFQNKISL